MNIILSYRTDTWRDRPVECYPRSYVFELRERGHRVLEIGEGHSTVALEDVKQENYDFFLEIENGRGADGKLRFQLQRGRARIPSGVVLIDSHGQPSVHSEVAPAYDHVFFAVWNRRDLYASHPSHHWCPCATDWKWFNPFQYLFNRRPPHYDFGFFGSKGGLHRADILKQVCGELGLSCDVRQVGKSMRHRWPETCKAMIDCKMLFNHGQKHDGPNQRVLESMCCGKLLFNDMDPKSGMDKLFEEGKHYLGYTCEEDLTEKIRWARKNVFAAEKIAAAGTRLVAAKHQIKNRLDLILDVYHANHR